MKKLITIFGLVLISFSGFAASAASSNAHPCSEDALSRALPLLTFHNGGEFQSEPLSNDNIVQHVKSVGTVKSLGGKEKYDVLEVNGYIYKSSYRMHFIYSQIPGICNLMGQEILEVGK